MTTLNDQGSIRDKVAKLLRQAQDRQGTPEGDVFEAKAFELMAKYGVEASQLDKGNERQAIRKDINFTGSYSDLQFRLLLSIASILHCRTVRYHQYNKRTVKRAVLFGLPHHIDRVTILFDILNPQMIAGAKNHGDQLWADAVHTRRAKRSWMLGFIEKIHSRLYDIEAQHTADYGRDGQSGDLVLLDDARAADLLAQEHFPFLKTSRFRSQSQVDPHAFTKGYKTGEMMDLGQTRVHRRRRSLTAPPPPPF
ncbi:DUF2786 domain-containing protein [Corynebacterium sp. 320]|uniref:DUF2786 domain-containing protein n=1 Tax=Corynebacterium TaxID=1716 RepID=UPI00125CBC28|nr:MULTISPECIES: DUF2786 domain-containing protein [Corynebacterium]KAB1502395.1 DUF2786 domain-containing protein [Corynebacterium sp. 320]KAB1551383.1 DUF2786 domain-containing protein [Corynebacterium sp. 321]KAB1551788.1 DUF2786 domain-containing protein [Corynebacterium sp. 319]KAB3526002.1 DUF2786 domain-containing protein [Corynebacterium sp. 250]KAB3538783.1 DUF2786 domain-containing protein [Corynebacterium sp. 366]